MATAEHIERYARFRAAGTFAPGETLRNYDSSALQIEVGSSSTIVSAPNAVIVCNYNRAYRIDAHNLSKVVGIYSASFTSDVFIASHGGRIDEESSATQATQIATSGFFWEDPADSDSEPVWINDIKAVLTHARDRVSEDVHAKLSELAEIVGDEDNKPLQVRSAGWFVHYCTCVGIARRPLMALTPTGELDATWSGGDDETVVMRFFSNETVWVALRLKSAVGSFEAVVSNMVSKTFPFQIPSWINARGEASAR